MMPRAGGEYVYLSRAFHPAVGFLSGWIGLLVGFAAPAAAGALAFGRYVHAIVPALPQRPIALALIVAVTSAHLVDVRFGRAPAGGADRAGRVPDRRVHRRRRRLGPRRLGATSPAPAARRPGRGPPVTAGAALALGLVYVSYAYFGWNTAAYVAGEMRDPARSLPRALVAGTGLVTALYVGLNVVFLWAAPPAALAGQVEVAHVVAGALFGPRGALLLSSLVALALAGSVSAFMMSGPRIAMAMAAGRSLLPRARPRRAARRADRGGGAAGRAGVRRGRDGDLRSDPGLRRLHAHRQRGRHRAGRVRAAPARAATPRARTARSAGRSAACCFSPRRSS